MNTGSGTGFIFENTLPQNTSTTNVPVSTPAASFGAFSTPASAAALTTTTPSVFSLVPNTGNSNIPTQTSNFNFTSGSPGITSNSSSTGLSFSAKTTKSVTFNFNTTAGTSVPSSTLSGILKVSSSVIPTSTSTSSVTSSPEDQTVNYLQLQDLTNKWITDFEDLQKLLLNQTSETINRDVILASNEDKIEKLVEFVSNLKVEQTQVEQRLDFILSQQRDLEECLTSLEDEVSSYFPELPADDMYKLAENIDSRLKKTLETSKEIITKINDKNRSSENVTNPMVAIGRILNHLTNSIQILENLNIEGQIKLNDLQKIYQQYAA